MRATPGILIGLDPVVGGCVVVCQSAPGADGAHISEREIGRLAYAARLLLRQAASLAEDEIWIVFRILRVIKFCPLIELRLLAREPSGDARFDSR
jgi:hypothetical protein